MSSEDLHQSFNEAAQLTPERQTKLRILRHKVSELSESGSPQTIQSFIEWHISYIRMNKAVSYSLREGYKESLDIGLLKDKSSYKSLRAQATAQEQQLDLEEKGILSQSRFLFEDLQDSMKVAEDAYASELYRAYRSSTKEGQGEKKKEQSLLRSKFSALVTEYYTAERQSEEKGVERWCMALGSWLPKAYTKCAHIIPKSFDTRELAYMFGVGDAALGSERNGLILCRGFEEGFDNGWAVIVPDGSVQATPTEWKIVVLNDAVKHHTVWAFPDHICRWSVSDSGDYVMLETQ